MNARKDLLSELFTERDPDRWLTDFDGRASQADHCALAGRLLLGPAPSDAEQAFIAWAARTIGDLETLNEQRLVDVTNLRDDLRNRPTADELANAKVNLEIASESAQKAARIAADKNDELAVEIALLRSDVIDLGDLAGHLAGMLKSATGEPVLVSKIGTESQQSAWAAYLRLRVPTAAEADAE